MKLPVPFLQLPLLFDAEALAAEIAAIGEEHWRPHPEGFAGNSMLPMVAVNGDPADERFRGTMRPTPYLEQSPYLRQVFARIGATIGRSRLMRLAGQAEVSRHADQGYYWAERMRVHVPIVTQPTVRFECGNAAINMRAGECWIFDTWRQHRVINDATAQRIHLVIDTVGGPGFWDLAERARPHDAPPQAPWQPQRVAPVPGTRPEIPCESVNLPTVMSPWELSKHFDLLFAEAMPHPNLRTLAAGTKRFIRAWHALWFRHGDAPDGHDAFRRLLAAYVAEVAPLSQPIKLKNELGWYGAMRAMIASAAVADAG